MQFRKGLLSFISVLCTVITAFPVFTVSVAATPEYEDVTKYSYSVTPVLSPFMDAVYVKTDNPDPTSFRLADKNTVYATEENPTGFYKLKKRLFEDVVYENKDIYRVKGGYIFLCDGGMPDGGELIVQQKIGEGSFTAGVGIDSGYAGEYKDTNITASCPVLQTPGDYMLSLYGSGIEDFFSVMDKIQAALSALAIYPRSVQNLSQPTGYYPALAASAYYPEHSLNEHYETLYKDTGGLLLYAAYPFVLDSLGFPGTMEYIAKKLNPAAEVGDGPTHAYVSVTFNGETRNYGGSGSGNGDVLYSKHVDKWFTFDGKAGDYFSDGTVASYREKLVSFDEIATEDAKVHRNLIAGEVFKNTIAQSGGTWIRIAVEYMFGSGISYGYALPFPTGGVRFLSEAWVDGRFIGKHEMFSKVEAFDDYPTADIVITDMTYKDQHGNSYTRDVLFEYDSKKNLWSAARYYSWFGDNNAPEEFYLTREEISEMGLDKVSHSYPESGLIYDGTAYPGTAFKNTLVTGVDIPEKITALYDRETPLEAVIYPDKATVQKISWSSADKNIAVIHESSDGQFSVFGVNPGTTTLTVETQDGRFRKTCTVTVEKGVITGTCGDSVNYSFDYTSGVLTLTGAGETDSYSLGGIDPFGYTETTPFDSINKQIKTIVIENSVTELGDYLFCFCPQLEKVILPDTLKEISPYAFHECPAISGISLGDKNESFSLKNGVLFTKDRSVLVMYPSGKTDKEYKIPDSVKEINQRAFSCNGSIQNIIIPDTVTLIGIDAFYALDNLKTVNLPDKAEFEWRNPFYDCPSLGNIIVSDESSLYRTIDGVLFNKDGDTLIYYPEGRAGKTYTVPDGTKKIALCAFLANDVLTEVYFPTSLEVIESYAFERCSALEAVFLPKNLTGVYNLAFAECTSLKTVMLEDGISGLTAGVFDKCKALTEVYVPDSVTAVPSALFRECFALEKVSLPAGLTKIGSDAFSSCLKLKYIYFRGTSEQWNNVKIEGKYNSELSKARVYTKEHKFGSGEIIKNSSCRLYGIEKFTCSGCGISKYASIPEAAHKELIKTAEVPPTCTESGKREYYKCSQCKKTFLDKNATIPAEDIILSAVGHSFGAWETTKAPTEYEEGLKTRQCRVCDKRETAPIERLEISFKRGDVDNDGSITASDARLALRRAVGLEAFALGSDAALACDANRDNIITAADARLILRASVGLEELI